MNIISQIQHPELAVKLDEFIVKLTMLKTLQKPFLLVRINVIIIDLSLVSFTPMMLCLYKQEVADSSSKGETPFSFTDIGKSLFEINCFNIKT